MRRKTATRLWSSSRCARKRCPSSDGATRYAACGEPIRRYEHDQPGSLIHVDVEKLGNIPDGGGWRYVDRPQGKRNRVATPAGGPLDVGEPVELATHQHRVHEYS